MTERDAKLLTWLDHIIAEGELSGAREHAGGRLMLERLRTHRRELRRQLFQLESVSCAGRSQDADE